MVKKQAYACILKALSAVLGMDAAKRFDARLRDHKSLNLKNPRSLAEKVSYIELHLQSPLAPMCTDKYAVREYVANKGLADILIPLVYNGCWTNEEQIDFDTLPKRFVLKATHGCKMNYIVPDKEKLDVVQCKKEVRRWLHTTYGTYSMEPHYIGIPHRVYAEQYISDAHELNDYKFHCLNGKPQFVLVCSNRKTNGDQAMQVTLDLFDTHWNHLDELVASGAEHPGDGRIPRPSQLVEMVDIAQTLAEDFRFVRVDLYEKDGQVFFGELTFTPAHCVFPYLTDDFNDRMGELLRLD